MSRFTVHESTLVTTAVIGPPPVWLIVDNDHAAVVDVRLNQVSADLAAAAREVFPNGNGPQ